MRKINIRGLNAGDLENVLSLFAGHTKVKLKRKSGFQRRLLLSYILGASFSLLGEDTFIGSLAETDDENILGAVFARRFPFGKSWVLGPVVLHLSSRGSGVATRMMNFAVEQLRKRKARLAVLSVGTSNIQARRFFEKCDFKYLGSVFMDHDQARKYVRIFTLISGYLPNTVYKIGRYPLETKIAHSDQKPRTNRIGTWRIMVRDLRRMPEKHT